MNQQEDERLYYGNHLVNNVQNKPEREKQLWLLNNHPIFTGVCPNCGYDYGTLKILDIDEKSQHWNCPSCGLTYD
jgi:transposase-like protein